MKKMLSVLLSLIIMATVLIIPASADDQTCPAILVTGYASSKLYINYGEENEEQVWPFAPMTALSQTASDFVNLTSSLLQLAIGNSDMLGRTVAAGGKVILEKLFCNPDGTSKYEVETYPNEPAMTNYTYLVNEDNSENLYESELAGALAEAIGGENVFVFQYDFRMSSAECAKSLRDFIGKVCDYADADEVNLFGLSYGGFIVGTYLSMYSGNSLVNNAVMSVPALGGTSFAKDFLLGEVDLAITDLASIAESALGFETNVAGLLAGADMGVINSIASSFLKEISDLPLNWGSMWALLTTEDYAVLKTQLLDNVKNAEIIEESDYIHEEIMDNYRSAFAKCRRNGTRISILCSSGSDTAFGDDSNADLLLDVEKVSGAVCAPYGERFADGYRACGRDCADSSHYHVSPALSIDASSAYLPENTWFVDGQYHGMYAFEDYTFDLVKMLMLTDSEITVHTYKEYPQFEISSNSFNGIYAKFNAGSTGYIGAGATALTVKNISKKYSVKIVSIECDGIDIKFNVSGAKTIKPGESAEFAFTGEIPSVSAKYASVTVRYVKIGSLFADGVRKFDFTVRNGEYCEEKNDCVPLGEEPKKSSITDFFKNLLKAIG